MRKQRNWGHLGLKEKTSTIFPQQMFNQVKLWQQETQRRKLYAVSFGAAYLIFFLLFSQNWCAQSRVLDQLHELIEVQLFKSVELLLIFDCLVLISECNLVDLQFAVSKWLYLIFIILRHSFISDVLRDSFVALDYELHFLLFFAHVFDISL